MGDRGATCDNGDMNTSAPYSTSTPSDDEVIALTRAWLEQAVIGLNLCPFAKAVHVKDQVRYHVSRHQDWDSLAAELEQELCFLAKVDPEQVDTTLFIMPLALAEFLEYNDFLDWADRILERLELDGELQIASFHPHYQFADAQADDIENYSNRSPFPMLHLLRESSIDRAVAAYPDAAAIFEKNMVTLRKLGLKGWNMLPFVVTKEQR
ncbi:peptidase [Herbaspirillum rubrisubalbicans]|uniref:Peptidase n=2 Tax=Herbaspirillum rubrisubalbicans TaxID=80842 RepID=A0ABX9BWU5_9BURK|nr:peptidase [Herbaspirillum rubrisubalbicans]RAN50002.1 peptidase [Herbaspirillum rubrisubalbicans]